MAWDLTQLWASGNIGVVSANSGPALTNSFAFDNSTGTNKIIASFSWDASVLGYSLETQVNPLEIGLSNNWTRVAGSWTNTTVVITNNVGSGAVFYRLSFP